jgi:hypothetical protein
MRRSITSKSNYFWAVLLFLSDTCGIELNNRHATVKQTPDHQTIIDVPSLSRGRRRLLALLLLVLAIAGAAGWWAYKDIVVPNGYRASVQQGKALLLKGGEWFAGKELELFLELPEGHQATVLARKLLDKNTKGDDFEKQRIAADALALAYHLGEPRVLYEASRAYTEGLLSMQLSGIDSKSINDGAKGLEVLATKGEPVGTYVYGLMLSKGLGGLTTNAEVGVNLIRTVYQKLTEFDLMVLLYDIPVADEEIIMGAFKQSVLKDKTFMAPYQLCYTKHAGLKDGDFGVATGYVDAMHCRVSLLSAYESEQYPVISDALNIMRRRIAAIDKTRLGRSTSAGSAEVAREPAQYAAQIPRDREQQESTGYLKGAPILAQEGRSTFTVDNRDGGQDAVARIYLNGTKPAVRSMFVKAGESFTANKLPPGTYAFRYRFMGSNDTFEANTIFELKEVAVPGGTQFSRTTVTLFRVADGNMSVKKVSPESF